MARAALKWSIEKLAKASRVDRGTISNFETGKFAADPQTLIAIQKALERAGIIFERIGS
jgi:transcriptional regulator with XRE-family HTH domain